MSQMSNKNVIIDVQGYKDWGNNFIVKEIAVLYNENEYQRFLIKPPYDFSYLTEGERKQVLWLQSYKHGLRWNEGVNRYASVRTFLIENIDSHTNVYVKGVEKKKWITSLLGREDGVNNVEEIGCDSLDYLRKYYPTNRRCTSTSHSGVCALENVYLISNFLKNKAMS